MALATALSEDEFSDIAWRYLQLAPNHEGPLIELAEDCLRPLLRHPETLRRIATALETVQTQ